MPRSGQEARDRLQQAALELYRQHGFDRTTTAEIADRAGVNERTFFRHFPDKREVLFGGQAVLRELLVAAVDAAPAALPPLETLLTACLSVTATLEEGRSFAQPRYEVIAATPELHERELAKIASLADALAAALRRRGVPDQRAALAAQAGMAAFNAAVISWYDDPARGLDELLTRAFDDLRALAAP